MTETTPDPVEKEHLRTEVADRALLDSFRPRSDADFSEVSLIRRSTPLIEAFGGRLPLSSELKDIYENFGIEIAQTVFTQALERSPIYGGLIRRVRSLDPRTFGAIREKAATFEVTIVRSSLPVPGLPWGEFADRWQTWARSLGFTTDIIETFEDNDLRANAKIISTHLFSKPHPRRILVTYGQGSAELRSLIAQRMGLRGHDIGEAGELAQIHTWINVAGAFSGASIARLENESWLEKFKVGFSRYFGRFSLQARATRLRQLDPRLPAWRTLPNLPSGMQVINVVGLAFRKDLPLSLKVPSFDITRAVGPNDGAIGAYEAIAHPGLIFPIPGMSQMAENVKLEPVLKRLLAVVVESGS